VVDPQWLDMAFRDDDVEADRDFDLPHDSPDAEGQSPGPLQPMGGGGEEPEFGDLDIELFPNEGNTLAKVQPSIGSCAPEPRTKARCLDLDAQMDDIPIEEFRIPAVSTAIPSLRPTGDCRPTGEHAIGGASMRRKEVAPSSNPFRPQQPFSGVTGRRPREVVDVLFLAVEEHLTDINDSLSDDEFSITMPKMPFASRLITDAQSAEMLPREVGSPRLPSWLATAAGYSHGLPPAMASRGSSRGNEDKEAARGVLPLQPQSRQQTPPVRNPPLSPSSSARDIRPGSSTPREKLWQGVVPEFLFNRGLDVKLSMPEASKRPQNAGAEAVEERIKLGAMDSAHKACKDDDEDSWAQELLADSPRTFLCEGACNLVPLASVGLTGGLPPGSTPLYSDPADDAAISGLSDFLNGADDAVLSYILNQAADNKALVNGVQRVLPVGRLQL